MGNDAAPGVDGCSRIGERDLRIDLAAAFRLAARFDLHEGICNHFTARVGERDFLLNPDNMHWPKITASCLLLVQGGAAPTGTVGTADSVAYRIHWPVYRSRSDVGCILHTHMLYATALCMVENGRLEMGEQTALRFHGGVAYDDEYPGPVGTEGEAEGERLARKLDDKRVLFAKNHGIVVAGASVGEAFSDLYYLERCCKKQWIARGYGLPLSPIPDSVANATMAWFGEPYRQYKRDHFNALKRVLDEEEPEYKE